MQKQLVMVRGGGELGSAIAHAFALRGLRVLVVDRPLPGALRLGVAFAAAAVEGQVTVEGVQAIHCRTLHEVETAWTRSQVAVWTAAPLEVRPVILVDARMRALTEPLTHREEAELVMGVGPGFEAGKDVHWVIESNRGSRLGEAIACGRAEAHSGIPGVVQGLREERLLRAPCAGKVERARALGAFVEKGDVVAWIDRMAVHARIGGMVRGLKLTGVGVGAGHKVGDIDPRRDRALLGTMTDKARAIAQGALRAAVAAALLPPESLEACGANTPALANPS